MTAGVAVAQVLATRAHASAVVELAAEVAAHGAAMAAGDG